MRGLDDLSAQGHYSTPQAFLWKFSFFRAEEWGYMQT